MDDTVEGKGVVITGAAGGIGAATARLLAAKGARVMLVDLNPDALAALAAEIGEAAIAHPADVTSEADMAGMADAAMAHWGRIDALVSAAGILRTSGRPLPLAETTFEEFRKVVDVNLTGTFLSNRAVLGPMLKQRQGDIVNISSVSGRQGRAFDGPYAASKFGIIGLSESLSEEVSRDGVRVQTVLPDAVDTGIWAQSGTAALRPRAMLTADHVARLIHTLLTLPRDSYLLNTVVAPLAVRGRKKAGPTE